MKRLYHRRRNVLLTLLILFLTIIHGERLNAQTLEDGSEEHPFLIENTMEFWDFYKCMTQNEYFYFDSSLVYSISVGVTGKGTFLLKSEVEALIGQDPEYLTKTTLDTIVSGGKKPGASGLGIYFKLLCDVTVNNGNVAGSDGIPEEGWIAWTPMEGFSGHFDGNYHVVSGIYCNTDSSSVGFFSQLTDGATLSNLGLVNSYFSGKRHVGAFVGWILNESFLSHCFFEGTVESTADNANDICLGGLAGSMQNSTISDCYSTGYLYCSYANKVGGLVGNVAESSSVRNCYTSMTINFLKSDGPIGGIVGFNDGTGNVSNCYFDLQMTDLRQTDLESLTYGGRFTRQMASMDENWTVLGDDFAISSGLYPYLTHFCLDTPAVRLSVQPVFLACTSYSIDEEYETMTSLHSNFTLSADENVSWSTNPDPSAGGSVQVNNSTHTATPLKEYKADLIASITHNGKTFTRSFWVVPHVSPFLGSASNPFTIDTLDHLRQFRIGVTSGEDFVYRRYYMVKHDSLPHIHWLQTADIDLSPVLNDWTHIGDSTHPFTGYYDGGGHIIRNLSVNQTNTNARAAFFGQAKNAYIHDLHFIDAYAYGNYASVLCGYAEQSEIWNCSTKGGRVRGTSDNVGTGGICGYAQNTTITNCINYGTPVFPVSSLLVSNSGIVGEGKTTTVKNCINYAQVGNSSYNSQNSGGIVGYGTNMTIEYCFNYGNVLRGYWAGGIIGNGGGNSNIRFCLNTGKIICHDASINDELAAGGVSGCGSNIASCINMGEVQGRNASGIQPTGGSINYCINSGQIRTTQRNGGGISATCTTNYSCNFGLVYNTVDAYNVYGISSVGSDGYNAAPVIGLSSSSTVGFNNRGFYEAASIGEKYNMESGTALAQFEMIGKNTYLANQLGETHWVYEDNMYPRPKWTDTVAWAHDIAVAICSPVILSSQDQNFSRVRPGMKLVGCDSNVVWKVQTPEILAVGACLFHDFSAGDTITGICTDNAITPAIQDTCLGFTTIGAYVSESLVKTVTLRRHVEPVIDTLIVSTLEDLVTIQEGVNSESPFYYHDTLVPIYAEGIVFRMINNINVTLADWEPIGVYPHHFAGTFLGNNDTIFDVKMSGRRFAGFFGTITGCVKDLNLANVNISGESRGGALCARLKNGKIIHCSVSGSITGSDYHWGGIVGWTVGTHDTIVACTNYATVKSTSTFSWVGGIVGTDNSSGDGLYIAKCVNYGNHTGSNHVGGIVGGGKSYITACVNYGTLNGKNECGGICGIGNGDNSSIRIYDCVNYGSVTGDHYVAGIMGSGNSAKIYRCVNSGDVSGGSSATAVGGIVTNSYAEECYNTGAINANPNCSYLGGISAAPHDTNSPKYCYNVGAVTASGGNANKENYVGGICGKGNPTYCYNAGQVFGANRMYVGGITGNGNPQYCYNSNTIRSDGTYKGSIAGTGTANDCYYDQQLSTLGAVNNIDNTTNKVFGKNVDDMLGAGLQNLLGTNSVWDFSYGDFYPQLACFTGTAPSVSSVMSMRIVEGETWQNIATSFQMHGCVDENTGWQVTQGNCIVVDGCGAQVRNIGVCKLSAYVNGVPYRQVRLMMGINENTPFYVKNETEMKNFRDVINYGGYYNMLDSTYHTALPDSLNPPTTAAGSVALGNYIEVQDGGLDIYFLLLKDLSFSGDGIWTPVGDHDPRTDNDQQRIRNAIMPFRGTFKGNYKTITGLDIERDANFKGLFGYVDYGCIRDLTISDSRNPGGMSQKALLCGCNRGGIIYNCIVENSTLSEGGTANHCGMLCGDNQSGTIENCYAIGNTIYVANSGSQNRYGAGGICGYNIGGSIINCHSERSFIKVTHATINYAYEGVGGICGNNSGAIQNCSSTNDSIYTNSRVRTIGGISGTNSGIIQDCYSINLAINAPGYSYIGGIVGYVNAKSIVRSWTENCRIKGSSISGGIAGGVSNATIDGCHCEGLMLENSGTNTGGIVGTASKASKIQNSFVTNSLIVGTGGVVGGIVGELTYDTPSQVLNCANINTNIYSPGSYVGGICGKQKHACGIKYCYCIGGEIKADGSYVGGIIGCQDLNGSYVNACYNENVVKGKDGVGGICGSQSMSSVKYCYNSGNVSATGNGVGGILGSGSGNYDYTIIYNFNIGIVSGVNRVGGIVGYLGTSSYAFNNNYNAGIVHGISQIGGVVGATVESTKKIEKNYNTGWVDGNSMVGAICGYAPSPAQFQKNCYDRQMSHYAGLGDEDVAGITVKLTNEMLGNGAKSILGDAFSYATNLYPRLKTIDTGRVALASALPLLLPVSTTVPTDTVMAKDVPAGTYTNALTGCDSVNWVRYDGSCYTLDACSFTVTGRDFMRVANVIHGDTLKVVHLQLGISEEHPVEIVNLTQFRNFRNYINAHVVFYYDTVNRRFMASDSANSYIAINPGGQGMYFRLNVPGKVLNIGLDGDADWIPIGNSSSTKFLGSFDGNNHSVMGMKISGDGTYKGLFGYLQGSVSNLEVLNPDISGTGNYHGAIAGYAYGTISNCHSSGGVVNGSTYVGGLVGYSYYSQIKDCYNGSKVTGVSYVGGIVGQCATAGKVLSCFNFGMIEATASSSYVGGITGSTAVELSNCYNTGVVNGNSRTAGIAGWSTSNLLRYCYNAGYINSGSTAYVGAIANMDNNSYRPQYCYYDKEMCTVSGMGSTSGAVDAANYTQGLLTTAMTGTAIQTLAGSSRWSSSVWAFNDNEYPRLLTYADSAASSVSVQPVFLSESQKINDVSLPFTVGTNDGVGWSRKGYGNALNLDSLAIGKVGLVTCGSDTLQVSLRNDTRVVPLYVVKLTANAQEVTACGSYYWPVTGRTYTYSGISEPYTNIYTRGIPVADGCDSVVTLHLTLLPAVTAQIVSQSPTCFNVQNHSAEVVVTGGSGNGDHSKYLYTWTMNNPASVGDTISSYWQIGGDSIDVSLSGSTYYLTVTDGEYPQCAAHTQVTLTRPVELKASVTGYDAMCYGGSDGYINVRMEGGTVSTNTGYTIRWTNPDTETELGSGNKQAGGGGAFDYTIGNLADGKYVVTVYDENNCSVIADTVEIASKEHVYTVSSLGINKKYDGEYFYPAFYTLDVDGLEQTIASDDNYNIGDGAVLTASVSVLNPMLNVVDTTSILSYYIIKDGADSTCRYNISSNDSKIIISKRSVTLTSASATDTARLDDGGDPICLTAPTVTVGGDGFANGSVNGQEGVDVSFDENSKVCTVAEGSKDNAFSYSFKSNTIEDNYQITVSEGTLLLSPSVASIVSKSATKVYDGINIEQPGYIYNSVIASTDTVLVTWNASTIFKNVGTVENLFTSYRVVEKANPSNDRTSEYSFGDGVHQYLFYGNLTITPRHVVLTTPSSTKVYDGMPLMSAVVVSGDGFVQNPTTGNPEVEAYANTSITSVGSVKDTIKLTTYPEEGYFAQNYTIDSTWGTLTVTKRPLTLTGVSENLIYNGTEQTVTGFTTSSGIGVGLLTGHTISGITYSASRRIQGETVGHFSGTLLITDTLGNNVTANYEIDTVPGTLTISPSSLELKITSNAGNHIYDGQWYRYWNYTVNYDGHEETVNDTVYTLATGDQLTIHPIGAGRGIIHVAESDTNNFTYELQNEALYSNVKLVKDSIKIIPRHVQLLSPTITETYTGALIPVSGSAVMHDTAVVRGGDGFVTDENVFCILQTQKYDVGNYENRFSYTLTGDARDYIIDTVYGIIRIKPSELILKADAKSKLYGDTIPSFTYTLSGLASRDMGLELKPGPKLTTLATTTSDVGSYTISVDTVGMTAENSVAELSRIRNYNIVPDSGILVVYRRPIDITASVALDTTYDGKQHYYTEAEAQPDGKYYTVNHSQLVSGDSVVSATLTGVRKDAGITQVNISDAIIKRFEIIAGVLTATADVTDNYIPAYTFGSITINQRAITLKPKDFTHQFTGSTYTSDSTMSPHYDIVSGSLQGKDSIVAISISGSRVASGVTDFVIDASSIVIVDTSVTTNYSLVTSEYNLTDNYNITCENGTLTVQSRSELFEIHLPGRCDTITYDGNAHRHSDVVANDILYNGGFKDTTYIFDGFRYKLKTGAGGLKSNAEGTFAGTYIGTIYGDTIVLNDNDNDVTTEFRVTVSPDTLVILPLDITLIAPSVDTVYDGLEHSYSQLARYPYITIDPPLFAGHFIQNPAMTGARTLPGTSPIVIDPTSVVITYSNTDVTSSFRLHTVDGSITIKDRTTPYVITLKGKSDTLVYDAQRHMVTDAFETLNFVIDVTWNHEIYPISFKVIDTSVSSTTGTGCNCTDTGNYVNTVDVTDYYQIESINTAKVVDANGNDVSKQFMVSMQNGNHRIIQREISVMVEDSTLAYNGEPRHGHNECNFINLAEGHTGTITYTPATGTEVGTYDNGSYEASTWQVLGANSVNVTDNYKLTDMTKGALVITRNSTMEVSILGTTLFEYDAQEHSIPTPTVSNVIGTGVTTIYYSTVDPESASFDPVNWSTTNPNFINVAETPVTVYVMAVNPNYDTAYNHATLSINRKAVTIDVVDAEKTFGENDPDSFTAATLSGGIDTELDGIVLTVHRINSSVNDAGEYEKVLTISQSRAELESTYGNYSFTVDSAKFTINASNAMSITLPNTLTKIYDGSALEATCTATAHVGSNTPTLTYRYSTDGGNTWTAFSEIVPSITDAGSIKVNVRASCTNFNNIDSVFILKIDQREVTVSVEDKELEYNGDEQFGNTAYTFSNVVSGQIASITYTAAKGTLVDTYDNGSYGNDFKVMSGATDVTTNYTLGTQAKGKLIVKKNTKSIVVTSLDYNEIYDGQNHKKPRYAVQFGNTVLTPTNSTDENETYMLNGVDTLVLTPTSAANITNVAESGRANLFTHTLANASNYASTVQHVNGTLTVRPDTLTVTIVGHTAEYNFTGGEYTVHGYDASFSATIYPFDGNLTFSGDSTIAETAVGTYNMNLTPSQFVNDNTNYHVKSVNITDGWMTIYDSLHVVIDVTDVACYNENNGKATITVTGGKSASPRYSYTVTGENHNEDNTTGNTDDVINLTNLDPDTYTVTVTDTLENTVTHRFVISQPDTLVIATLTVPTSASGLCPNQATYPVSMETTGGNGTNTITWTGDAVNTGAITTNNASSTVVNKFGTNDCGHEYSVTVNVADQLNCTASMTKTFTVVDGENPTFTVPADYVTCTNSNGTIDTMPSVSGNVTDAADNCTAAPSITYSDGTYSGDAHQTITFVRTWTVTDACGKETVKTQNITVYPQVVMNTPESQTICSDSNITAIVFGTTITDGTMSYYWTRDNTEHVTGLNASGTGNIDVIALKNTETTAQTTTFTVTPTYTNNGHDCTGTPVTFTITVNPEVTLSITPIATQNITYGDAVSTLTIENAASDLEVTLTYNGTAKTFAETGLTYDAMAKTVTGVPNAYGQYVITATATSLSAYGCGTKTRIDTINVAKRDLTVKLDTAKIYDGLQFDCDYAVTTDGWTVTGLQNGAALIAGAVTGMNKNVGTYTHTGTESSVVIDEMDIAEFTTSDGIDNYNVSFNFSMEIKTNNKPIVITSGDHEFVYDGFAHSYPSYSLTYNGVAVDHQTADSTKFELPTGDVLSVINPASITYYYENREHNNSFSYTLENASNYDPNAVTMDTGTIRINAMSHPLEIASSGYSWIYDGNAHNHKHYTVKFGDEYITGAGLVNDTVFALPTGDTLTITNAPSITNVGKVANTFTYTLQHDILYIGIRDTVVDTLRVTPNTGVVVTVTGHTGEYNYDATIHHVGNFDVVVTDSLHIYSTSDFHFTGDSTIDESAAGSYNMGLVAAQFVNDNANYDSVTFNVTDGWMIIYDTLMVSGVTVDSVTCNGFNDGKVTLIITGGKQVASPYYNYSVTGVNTGDNYTGNSDGTINLTNLKSDTYNVAITDALSYTATATFLIEEPANLTANVTAQADLCPNQANYAVETTITGGNGGNHFSWYNTISDGATVEMVDAMNTVVNKIAVNDCGHTYKVAVLVTDRKGCVVRDTVIFTVVDEDAPSFVRPEDLTICRNAAGEIDAPTSITGTPDPSSFADNCTPVSQLSVSFHDTDTTGTDNDRRVIHRVWKVTDLCGKYSEQTQNITVRPAINTTNSEFKCPDNIDTVIKHGGCNMKLVNIGMPTFTTSTALNPAEMIITNNVPSDSIYEVGETIVTWTVIDSCGFSMTCEQVVKVSFQPCQDAVDREHNTYPSVRLGSGCKCWTTENLKSTEYSDGRPIDNVMDYASREFPNTVENVNIFGHLYNWYAAADTMRYGSVDSVERAYRMGQRIQGVCPEGWYLPSDEDYEELNIYPTTDLRSTSYWIPVNGMVNTNATGFNSLPGGMYNCSTGRFEEMMGHSYYWTCHPVYDKATGAMIDYICEKILVHNGSRCNGYSIRCIWDEH